MTCRPFRIAQKQLVASHLRSLDLSWSMTFMDSKEPSVILRVRISTFSIESIFSIRLQSHQLTHNVKTSQGDDWFRLCYLRFDARTGICKREPSSCAGLNSQRTTKRRSGKEDGHK